MNTNGHKFFRRGLTRMLGQDNRIVLLIPSNTKCDYKMRSP